MSRSKFLIIGHAQHGKDTAAEMLCDMFGLKAADSSRRSLEIFLFDKLAPKYGYKTIEEAYQDRKNHRAEWYEEIKAFNTPDKTRLARNIIKDSDIYVGMRCPEEIAACRSARLFDQVLWIDASERKPPEPSSSFAITQADADVVIDNNGNEPNLRHRLLEWWFDD